ncbi:MAG: TetR/AcrR family transcriptional regulator [Spirosomataceae bacterium]
MIKDKKAAIFSATLDLISDNGFHSSPMSELAKKAGVATGTIYHYFASKEQLIIELYGSLRLKINDTVQLDIENVNNLSYRERFRRFYFSLYEYYLRHPKEFLFLDQYASSPFITKIDRDDQAKLNQPIIDFIRKGVITMQLRDMPTRLLWAVTQAQVHALVRLHLQNEMLIDLENLTAGFNVCWEGIKKQ